MTTTPRTDWRPAQAVIVASTMFMEQLDGVILFSAIPSIAREFGVDAVSVGLAATAYLVAVAAFIPLGGWLANRFGGRRVFLASIVVFTIASALCAAAPDLGALTASRILQGMGGALMVPVGQLIVLRTTGKTDLFRAIATITWPALLAPVIAPTLGGALTAAFGWRWIFLVNLPIGVIAFVAAFRVIRDTHDGVRSFDWRGLVLTTLAVTLLIVGLELLGAGRSPAVAAGFVVGAVVAGAAAVAWLRRAAHPLLRLDTLRIRTFRASNSGGLVYRMVISSVPFLMPLLLQEAFGFGIVESSILVTAVFVGNVGIKPATTPLLKRLPFRTVIAGATIGGILCLVAFAFFTPTTPPVVMAAVLLVSGVFRSVGFTGFNTLQFSDVPPELLPSANTVAATVSQVAVALGVAVASTIVGLTQSLGLTGADPYRWAFGILAALAVVALVDVLGLPRSAGDAARRRAAAAEVSEAEAG